jgi:glycosyltransferase involved in cell wall biosynthesis
MKYSICIPTYNRTDLLYQSFAQVLNDDRIDEVVIVDDCSSSDVWNAICIHFGTVVKSPKVKLFRNETNLDCYRNKREAISKASNQWCILLDSDNVIDTSYLDAIYLSEKPFDQYTIFQPSFAKPHFNFGWFSDRVINKASLSEFINNESFQTMLNAMNFVVNRTEYLNVWDGSLDPVTSDSIYFNYKWLEAGNSIYVVPGMHYEHRVHNGSHYQNNVKRTPKGFHESIVQKLKAL